ncbi:MAG: hypothetical protein H7296_06745 [Bacteroidia bacterium]|nr:hypothetical protein [Bacteroidia bacterium]
MFNNIITFGDNHDDPTLYHNCMATAYFSANLRCSIYINGKKTKPNDRGRKLSLINEAEIISIRNSHPLFYFGGWRGKIKIITK